MANNAAAISTVVTGVSNNAGAISSNAAGISNNAGSISSNAAGVSNNAAAVSSNDAEILSMISHINRVRLTSVSLSDQANEGYVEILGKQIEMTQFNESLNLPCCWLAGHKA